MSKKLRIQLDISILRNKTFPQPLHFSLRFSGLLCGTFKETNSTKRRTQWSRWSRCCIQRSSRDWFSQLFSDNFVLFEIEGDVWSHFLYMSHLGAEIQWYKKFTVWKFTPTLEPNKFVTDFWWIFIFMLLFLKSTTFGFLHPSFARASWSKLAGQPERAKTSAAYDTYTYFNSMGISNQDWGEETHTKSSKQLWKFLSLLSFLHIQGRYNAFFFVTLS